jgi:pyrroline-5-carboxylate reductase
VFDEMRNFVKRKAIIISNALGITTRFIEDNIQKNVVIVRALADTLFHVPLAATVL